MDTYSVYKKAVVTRFRTSETSTYSVDRLTQFSLYDRSVSSSTGMSHWHSIIIDKVNNKKHFWRSPIQQNVDQHPLHGLKSLQRTDIVSYLSVSHRDSSQATVRSISKQFSVNIPAIYQTINVCQRDSANSLEKKFFARCTFRTRKERRNEVMQSPISFALASYWSAVPWLLIRHSRHTLLVFIDS